MKRLGLLFLIIAISLSGCRKQEQQPPVTPPAQVVPPSPSVPVPAPPVVTPQPPAPEQGVTWVQYLTSKSEPGVKVVIKPDSISGDRVARVHWSLDAPSCDGCYFVGLDRGGRTIMVDYRSKSLQSGEMDGTRYDIERVALWAVRKSQY